MTKLIYQPKGKAKEYSPWACNLYLGCSNKCEYCYNRHCQAKAVLGKDIPTLKKGLTPSSAVELFTKELAKYKDQIIADGKGLFFNFVSDPFLPETYVLNWKCARIALQSDIPVVFLSKCEVPNVIVELCKIYKDKSKIGFTLTGRDDLEPGANPNRLRIKDIEYLNALGIKTWASIEPVINLECSLQMIEDAYKAGCREFKIGLNSLKKDYTPEAVKEWKGYIDRHFGNDCNILWKDSVINYIANI